MSHDPQNESTVAVRAPRVQSRTWKLLTGHRLHFVPGQRHEHGHWRCLDCGRCHVATHHFLGVPCTPEKELRP
jgi:hypothetical protein